MCVCEREREREREREEREREREREREEKRERDDSTEYFTPACTLTEGLNVQTSRMLYVCV